MKPRKRVLPWIAGICALFLVLFSVLLFLLPGLTDQTWFRRKIEENASILVGGTVGIQETEFHYWPHPHLTLRGTNVVIPGTATGTIRSLTVFPGILPLFLGEIRIRELRITEPVFSVTYPEKPVTKPEKGEKPPSLTYGEILRSALASMTRSVPDMRITLRDGRMEVSGWGHPPLTFREIAGNVLLPPTGPEIDLSCTGTLWDRGSVRGSFHAGSFKGEGQIVLKGFRPHLLAEDLIPGSGIRVSDSSLDLTFRVGTAGPTNLHAEGDVSISRIDLYRRKRTLALSGGTVQATLDRDGEKIDVALTRLFFDSPRLSLSGNMVLDGESERSRAEGKARDVDIASVRKHILEFAGDVPLLQDIFSIVKAGSIPVLVFHTEGRSASDLWDPGNMEFEGDIHGGKITIDAGNTILDIDRVRGNLGFSREILSASGLEGSLGNITARNGKMRLGFLGAHPPFQLEADVSAPLAELPPLLTSLIPSKAFREELSLVTALNGNAAGRLILGETVDSVRVTVETNAMNLSAMYERLPHPLTVSGGKFLYRGDEISISDMQGGMGNSTFTNLAAQVRMTDPPSFEIRSGEFRLSLDQLYPWARATEGLRKSLDGVQAIRGAATVSVAGFEGPLFSPGAWHFDVSGNAEGVTFSIPFIPAEVTAASGMFRATPDNVLLTDVRIVTMDASLAVTGSLDNFRSDARRGVATVSGHLGPEAVGFLWDKGQISPRFLVRSPIAVSKSRLEWQKNAIVALSGDFVIDDGPKVSFDLSRPPGEWVIRNLSIADKDSQATLSLHGKPGGLDFTFDGFLSQNTVNRIIAFALPPGGWLKGDFGASLRFDQPDRSTVRGTLEGQGLRLPVRTGRFLSIDTISLVAKGNRIAIQPTTITIGDNRILLQGKTTASRDGITFDLDASTDTLDWESLQKDIRTFGTDEEPPGKEKMTGERTWDLPVRGTVRFRSGHIRYGKYTVEPVTGEIALGKDEAIFSIAEAALCGIPFTGTIRAAAGETTFEFLSNAKDGDADSVWDCLTDDKGRITGLFDLTGDVSGSIPESGDPVRSLRGHVYILARNGKIYGAPIITRVFSFLNLTEIFRGKIPDMITEGLEYKSYSVRGTLRDAELVIQESVLDGKTIDVVGQGRINIATEECDLTMLVAPFTTLNYVIGKVPLLGYILDDTLVEVPVKVSGTTSNPKVSLLNTAEVGKNLLGIVERTFLLPAEIIRPLLPEEKKEDQGTE